MCFFSSHSWFGCRDSSPGIRLVFSPLVWIGTITLTLFVGAVTALFTNGVFVSDQHVEPPLQPPVVKFKYDFEHFGDLVVRCIVLNLKPSRWRLCESAFDNDSEEKTGSHFLILYISDWNRDGSLRGVAIVVPLAHFKCLAGIWNSLSLLRPH